MEVEKGGNHELLGGSVDLCSSNKLRKANIARRHEALEDAKR
jgi:hypothetical protein